MKKLILTILVFSNCLIYGQITITSNDLPKAGRVNILGHDTLSTPNIGVASPTAQVWDFTAINVSYPQFANYSSTTPYHQYADTFPQANIYTYGPSLLYGTLAGAAPINYTNFGYLYLSSDVNGLSVIGYKSSYGLTHQQPKEIIIQTPANLNDSYNDSSYWEVDFADVPTDIDTTYKSTNFKTVTIDAFGSLTTSFGTYDVLRIHEYYTKVDSVIISLNGTFLYSMEVLRDTVNNYHFWTNDMKYPVAIVTTDAQNNVKITEVLLDTISSYQISGRVYNTDGSQTVEAGRAQLVPRDQIDNLFGVQEEVSINSNGYFQFSNVLEFGNFIVVAIPDAIQYPDLIPTYFGDEVYWQNATAIQPFSDTSITIYCQNNSYWQNYPGNGNLVTGIIWQNLDNNKGPGNSTPARGIRVTIEKNPSGEIVRHTETDINGVYSFSDLPSMEYSIVVDIPGLEMDSTYHFDLNVISNQTYAGHDFVYDSTKIYIYDATDIHSENSKHTIELSLYPNPFKTTAYVKIQSNSLEMISYVFDIFDVSGKLVKNYTGSTNDGFFIDSEGLQNGIYIYKLQINNQIPFSGKIIIQKL